MGMGYVDGLLVYFFGWLILIAVLWVRELLRVRSFEWHLSKSRLFHCDHCHHSFIIKEAVNLTRCPRCNSISICRERRNLE